MNKLKLTMAGLFVACLGIGVVSAQTGTTTAPAKTATTTTAGNTTAKPAQHLKKDGTPDKRYKENKTGTKSTGTKKAAPATAPAATPAK